MLQLVQQAEPLTRHTGDRAPGDVASVVLIDDTPVRLRGDLIVIGSIAFRVDEVRDYALRGQNLPLAPGRPVQAAVAMLVVATAERDAKPQLGDPSGRGHTSNG